MIAVVGSVSTVLACRYNVRETGFVDFGMNRYQLLGFVSSSVPPQLSSKLRGLAEETLADSCVSFELISTEERPDHPALDSLKAQEYPLPRFALVSSLGNTLWLDDTAFPPPHVSGEGFVRILSSPVRSQISETLATAFAVVLLIEGKDTLKNNAVQVIVDQAIEILEAELEYFPKPIKKGPAVVGMTLDQAASEQILLWSLGLTKEDLDRPSVAVLYGRGRWIGPLMVGDEVSVGLLTRVLFLVGADCECDLDPRMLRGTAIPIPWDERLQAIVAQDLGFDPNNPLVRMEVGQIMRVRTWQDRLAENGPLPLSIPEEFSSAGRPTSNQLAIRLFIVLGGLTAVVLSIGALLLVRSRKR